MNSAMHCTDSGALSLPTNMYLYLYCTYICLILHFSCSALVAVLYNEMHHICRVDTGQLLHEQKVFAMSALFCICLSIAIISRLCSNCICIFTSNLIFFLLLYLQSGQLAGAWTEGVVSRYPFVTLALDHYTPSTRICQIYFLFNCI